MRTLNSSLSSTLALALTLAFNTQAEPSAHDIYARLNQGPGNVTVTETGRVIFSQHQFYEPGYSVVELKGGDVPVPFPNAELNDRNSRSDLKLDSVLGIRAAPDGIVWMLDNGMRGSVTPKLVGWDTKTDRLHRVIYLNPPVTPKDQFVNDFAVDLVHKRIFISDPAGGADAGLIVVDLETGAARRVLQGHMSVVPENVDLVIDGRPVQVKDARGNLARPHIGVNPITEDLQSEWVYFGPMHGHGLYRVKAADLADDKLPPETLAQRVERYADKPISDGISIDQDGNIYLGELAENAIGVITPDRKYRRLSQGPNLSWVDSFSFGPEGKLYAVVNRLHQSAVLNAGGNTSKPPYFLLRVNALASGMAGR
jgi:sugar lactone lactonase YvrE